MTDDSRPSTNADDAHASINDGIAQYAVSAFRDNPADEYIGSIEWWIDPPYKASEVRERTWSFWLEIENENGSKAVIHMDMRWSDVEPLLEALAEARGLALVGDEDSE